ncbi:MAG: 1-acyl-sn-glycerol-3-phosphate acyltransferase, partial [Luteolibacter sp.]
GDVVCLFPEGQLTRTGTLCKLQRGFELIAKKAGCPVVPVWVDGTWGSIFSFERNCFFRKFPRRYGHGIAVAFGEPMMESAVDCRSLQLGLLASSAEAVARRFRHHGGSSSMLCRRSPLLADFNSRPAAERARFRTNGHQIGMINGLPRSSVFHMLRDDSCTQLLGLSVAFPCLFRAKLELHDRFDPELDACWLGGEMLRCAIAESEHHLRRMIFYDFSSRSHEAMEKDGLIHCPSLAISNVVVAMSIPDPPQTDSGLPMQPGHKPGSWGRLLPGWSYASESGSGRWRVDGPAAPDGGILLPEGCFLDDEGFLISGKT